MGRLSRHSECRVASCIQAETPLEEPDPETLTAEAYKSIHGLG